MSAPDTAAVRGSAGTWSRHPVVAFVRAQPVGAVGLVLIVLMITAAVLAPWIAPFDPVAADYGAMLAPPSLEHPFGTDDFGRDILTRIMYGAQTAIAIGFFSSFAGCTIGAALGLASAYFGGWRDMLVQRFIDLLLSFPIIVLALVVVAMMGHFRIAGIDLNLICAMIVPFVPRAARVIRSAALTIRELPYIDAARSAGFSSLRIVVRHMAPNVLAPYLILVTAFIAQAILLEASLSFLGLGVTEPTPAWGLMLSGNAASFYQVAPWMILFPGAAISLAVFAFSLVGDALRDWLDPRFQT